ncbi:MAG: S-adenosylmethionine:tRNA ribosyltransferase-isomerase, partial [Candidatus Krumholzibacteria bacterium]|nr:S-adenosylmethionine:tRNA ribosyltransferase-isomerase [Candidatus Krumholzibacteria bacterium]
MKLSDFDYELPEELIAQYPAPKRDGSRLIVMNRKRDE